MINTARTNNDMGEEDSVDASLPKLLLNENENASDCADGAEGADAGASAGAGYDIAINM